MLNKRVIVGLSGGVDSAVSAWLLQQQGYRVEALFMKNWEEDDTQAYCAASVDLADATAVCNHLGIPLHTVNFAAEYWDRVFSRFLQECQQGRSPNPDTLCNKEIKFKCFLDYALHLGADLVATGHYAARLTIDDQYVLGVSVDVGKDQTYFLYTLGQAQLAKTLFPLAKLTKPRVRQLAAEIKLPNQAKKDSTGICFIGKRPFKAFLQRYLPPNPGVIETPEGCVIGQHEGLMYYTLGQRQGLRIGGQRQVPAGAWYVAAKDMSRNVLVAVQGHEHPLLYTTSLECTEVSWVAPTPPPMPFQGTAKVRYRQSAAPCVIRRDSAGRYRVDFAMAQWAVTPGQAIVFYQAEQCLGGGVIDAGH